MLLMIDLSTDSIRCWKLERQSNSPIGDVIQWYWPLNVMVNAVSCYGCGSSCISQNPDVRYSVSKIVELPHLMSPIHSAISFMEYLPMKEWLFSSQKSCTIWKTWPCFFGAKNIGELLKELTLLTVRWCLTNSTLTDSNLTSGTLVDNPFYAS
jgi:hypothetical protein